jgi:hypothetical protein
LAQLRKASNTESRQTERGEPYRALKGGGDTETLVRYILYSLYVQLTSVRDGIFKLLRSPGIDSKESISPAYEAM